MIPMKILNSTSLILLTSMSIAGCGGRGGGSTGGGNSTASATPTPDNTTPSVNGSVLSSASFSELTVPEGFEWRGVKTFDMTFDVVSNYSSKNGQQKNIHGSHIIKLFSTNDSETDVIPFYSGVTDKKGQLANDFSIPSHWESITIVAYVRDLVCTSTYNLDELASSLMVSCDIVLDED
ncbi:hypothetical protein BCT50_06775 [Vibrio lentus]|uniref:Lipoprotein n=2 Tax=Vibrio lentus TaxID=136468 RepID=A0A855IR87_9VIBR|nr:hypothetical protein BCT50_06775 [Vibrio lentus]